LAKSVKIHGTKPKSELRVVQLASNLERF